MSDTYYTAYEIGGKLHEDELSAFVEVLADGGWDLDWGDDPIKDVDDIHRALQDSSTLHVYNCECPWGHDDCLEEFCAAHGLPHRRTTDPGHDCSGEIMRWDPDLGGQTTPASDDSGPMIPLQHLRDLSTYRTIQQIIEDLEWFAAELPPFEIVKETVTV